MIAFRIISIIYFFNELPYWKLFPKREPADTPADAAAKDVPVPSSIPAAATILFSAEPAISPNAAECAAILDDAVCPSSTNKSDGIYDRSCVHATDENGNTAATTTECTKISTATSCLSTNAKEKDGNCSTSPAASYSTTSVDSRQTTASTISAKAIYYTAAHATVNPTTETASAAGSESG